MNNLSWISAKALPGDELNKLVIAFDEHKVLINNYLVILAETGEKNILKPIRLL